MRNVAFCQAELLAVRKTADTVKEVRNSITGSVTMYVYSQAALKTIQSSAFQSRVTLGYKEVLTEIRDCIRFRWVPGHGGE